MPKIPPGYPWHSLSESVIKIAAEVQKDSAHSKSHEMALTEELDDCKSRLASAEEDIVILKAELKAHNATSLYLQRENKMLKDTIPASPGKDVDMANMQAQSDLHREIVSTPASFTQ